MSKVRVYEVAKQLNISSKEIMDKLKEYGFEVHSHMSTLEDEEAQLIIGYYNEMNKKNEETQEAETKEVAEPATENEIVIAQLNDINNETDKRTIKRIRIRKGLKKRSL